MINANRNQEGDMRAKLFNQTIAPITIAIQARPIAHTTMFVPKEPLSRYQTPFSPKIEGMDPPKDIYAAKVYTLWDIRLEIPCQPRQTDDGPLEHLNVLMCRVFLSNHGDLGLK